jgi:hypothetical protein
VCVCIGLAQPTHLLLDVDSMLDQFSTIVLCICITLNSTLTIYAHSNVVVFGDYVSVFIINLSYIIYTTNNPQQDNDDPDALPPPPPLDDVIILRLG